jgi:hypothetical protein
VKPPASLDAPRGEGEAPEPSTVIIVVARGENSLYRYTRGTFQGEPAVDVILDRRHAERRRRDVAPSVERRQRDRRTAQRVDLLKAHGWLVMRGGSDAASH